MCYLLYEAIAKQFASAQGVLVVGSVPHLQRAIQGAFAGVLLIILGLELLDTLKTYFTDHRLRLEIILIVATIALGRHIIVLDFDRVTGDLLLDIAALTLAVTGGYYLVRRAGRIRDVPSSPTDATSAGTGADSCD
ncbi:phosphate-starvation-inducible PsiE family protein [Povalibacter sp.]|uniref:phosphate-starvation-inducible PsiE family protein n=1 Tax=Povalibacter sp. TaxID=1962978 RepID=UPI002F404651